MKVIYRISEGGYKKEKPEYITKINCLKNALKHFDVSDFLIIMDGVSEDLQKEIQTIYHKGNIFFLTLATLPLSFLFYNKQNRKNI